MIFKSLKSSRTLSGVLTAFYFFALAAPLVAADPDGAPSETELLEKQRGMEKDMEAQVQGLLKKIFGPEQSEVKASVTLSLLKQVLRKEGSGEKTKKKEENPLGETKFLLPGVPAPKNVTKDKEPNNTERQKAEQQKAQQQVSFKITPKNRMVTIFYNEKLKDKEPEARKSVMAMTDLKENELKFIPGKFFSSVSTLWDDMASDPKNLLFAALLLMLFLLLIWLFLPLTSFFKNYITAMKEKAGIEVKMESESQGEQEGAGGESAAGMTPEEIEAHKLGKGGEEEVTKKYAPFEYINEENLKRLLGVFRKEPPQVIALVISYLKPELVRMIYAELPPEIQTKVATESGALRQATEEQVRMVDENIKAKIDFLVGGVDNLIRILDEVDYKIRDNILEYLMNHRPQLYEKVRTSILLFDDVLKFPDLMTQPIIRELKTEQLARALRNASPDMLAKFMSNMSQGGAALLKEEMEYGRPASEEQIEQERQNIMNVVKRLENEGKITVREKKKISVFDSEDATSPLIPNLPEDDFAAGPAPAGSAQTGSGSDAESYFGYGSQLYSEQKYQDAIPYLQYVTQMEPGHAQAWQLLGHCYYGIGMMPEALQHYEYALTLAPEDQELAQWVEQFKQSVGS